MSRRDFLAKSGAAAVAAGATALSAPAVAQTASDTIRWRMASSFPKTVEVLFGTAEFIAKRVGQLTGGKFQISVHGAGEIVPPLQVLDAVEKGTIECGHTAPYYFIGKDPAWAIGTCVPFGLNSRQYNAWWVHGGGEKMFNDFTRESGVVSLLAGNTGSQMGGFFKKELKSPADLKGLKFRTGGMGGQVLTKLGVVAQQLAAGDIYPALEKGTIDAAEWVGPYDDEKLGLNKVAPYYYYPGFWEGGAMLHFMINLAKWNELPPAYQAILKAGAAQANATMLAKYDFRNPTALRNLIAGGAQLRPYPEEVMTKAFEEANKLYATLSAENADFKTIYESQQAYRNEANLWNQVAEYTFDTFMIRNRPRG